MTDRWQIKTNYEWEDMIGGCKVETIATPEPSAMQKHVDASAEVLRQKCQQYEIEQIIQCLDYKELIQLRELILKQVAIRERRDAD